MTRRHATRRKLASLIGLGLVLALGVASSPYATAVDPPACFDDSARVDLVPPVFSNPTSITNPLFPISTLAQVIQLGVKDGAPVRFEVTRLPRSTTITFNGQRVQTVNTQFVGYVDGRISEVAIDHFAQADDGAVWYFGEDVDNYEAGRVVDHEGTWRAGRDGPPGMIMPAHPQVGNVYRSENIPGLVFEEDRIEATGLTVAGPRGPVTGAIRVSECTPDGMETKFYAPGYGEFAADSSGESSQVALAVPIDALGTPTPAQLTTLFNGAASIFDRALFRDWVSLSQTLDAMNIAWAAFPQSGAPPLLKDQMTSALQALSPAIGSQDPDAVRQAAINVAKATLDLELRHRTPAQVDRDRQSVWTWQIRLDASRRDQAGIRGDTATVMTIAVRR